MNHTKSGQIVKQSKGAGWTVRVYLGRDANGKRKYLNKTVHGNKKDAQAMLTGLLRDRDMGMLADPTRMTLNAYLDHWLEAAAKGRVTGRTFDSYRGLLQRHVRPVLGGKRLTSLKPVEIQKLYSDMQTQGLSPRTVRYTHTVLKNALEQAVKWRMASHNPAQYVDLPKQHKKEMQALDADEARRFLAASRSSPYHAFYSLLTATGLRPGEALALRWRDVDLAKGTLTVNRAITWDANHNLTFEAPKTPKSRRTVPLPPDLVNLLADARDESDKLLFTTVDGAPMHPDNFPKRDFKNALERAGISKAVRLYDLRHSCATLLLQAGVHPKIVSERLGHASITLTLDTYSHVLPGMQEEATEKLGAILYGPHEQAEQRPVN